MESQNKAIKAYLKDGHSITAIQALYLFKCFRLAARIKDLKDSGMLIDSIMKQDEDGKRYAMYREVT